MRGINAQTVIKRKDVANLLLDKPKKTLAKQTFENDGKMRNLHVFFENSSGEMEREMYLLRTNSDNITHVSFMGVKETGSNGALNITYDKELQLQAIEYCKANGIATFLGVDNYNFHSSGYGVYDQSFVQSMLTSKADATIDNLMQNLDEYGLDGVNITFDVFGSGQYRDAFTSFMQKLGARLKTQNKLLMVSVGGYFKDNDEAESFYDYEALSEVCDFVHIILYDENSANAYNSGNISSPGCNSSLTHINRVLKFAY